MSDHLLPTPSRFLQPPAAPPPPPLPHRSLLLTLSVRSVPVRCCSPASSASIRTIPTPPTHRRRTAAVVATAVSGVYEVPPPPEGPPVVDAPTSIELLPVLNEEQFDRIVAEAQQLEEPVIVLWMANWCRKCIYLKPKLEKLAADYHPRIRFYCVDVNNVPQRLVSRAGITKMPTIQLWKDYQKQAEVIGGHKAWLVVDDVRRMIDNEN